MEQGQLCIGIKPSGRSVMVYAGGFAPRQLGQGLIEIRSNSVAAQEDRRAGRNVIKAKRHAIGSAPCACLIAVMHLSLWHDGGFTQRHQTHIDIGIVQIKPVGGIKAADQAKGLGSKRAIRALGLDRPPGCGRDDGGIQDVQIVIVPKAIYLAGLPLVGNAIAAAHKARRGHNLAILKRCHQPGKPAWLGYGVIIDEGNNRPRRLRKPQIARSADIGLIKADKLDRLWQGFNCRYGFGVGHHDHLEIGVILLTKPDKTPQQSRGAVSADNDDTDSLGHHLAVARVRHPLPALTFPNRRAQVISEASHRAHRR